MLAERIKSDLKLAMKSNEKQKVSTLRMVLADIQAREKESKAQLSDHDVISILDGHVKRRNESIEAFKKGGRDDLADKESAEIKIIRSYMPDELTEHDVACLIEDITMTGYTELGPIMRELMPKIKGRFSGKRAKEMVDEMLNQ